MPSSHKEIVNLAAPHDLPFSSAVRAGGLVYVSGVVAVGADGRALPGDITTQARAVLDRLAEILEAAGSSMAHAATVNVYLQRQQDFAALNEVYRQYWSTDPPTRTTVVSGLMLPGALVEVSAVGIPVGGDREVVHPGQWLRSPNPYSYGIRSGDTLFLAGMVPRDMRDNSSIGGDVSAQTRAVLDHLGEILATAGMAHADVVSARIFITETSSARAMNDVYRTYFPADPPARATVGAELMAPDFRVEITTVAVKGAERQAVTTPNPDGSAGSRNPNLSSAIRVGNRLFLSGLLGIDETNRGDSGAQTRATLGRLDRTLKAAGFDPADVVDSLVYLTDVPSFGVMNAAYREVFSNDCPARTTVCNPLLHPEGLVEIMSTAVR